MDIFNGHKLIVIDQWDHKTGKGEYLFKRDGTNTYSMHIIFRPNTIIVYGDIRPNVIFRQGGIDLLWLNGAVKSPDYLFSKVVGDIREYDGEMSKRIARELLLKYDDEDNPINMAEVDSQINEVNWDWESEANHFYEMNFNDSSPSYSYANYGVLAEGLLMFSKAIMNISKETTNPSTAFNKRSAGTSSEDSQTDKSASADRIPVIRNPSGLELSDGDD